MIKLLIIYWVVLNALVVVGGLIGWFQLKMDDNRSSHYLSRILMADALRGVFSLWGTSRFYEGLEVTPVFMIASMIVITLLTGAIWGWLAYTHGIINGGGWPGLLKRFVRSSNSQNHIQKGGR